MDYHRWLDKPHGEGQTKPATGVQVAWGDPFTGVPTGYEWIKTGDSATKQGRGYRWTKVEEMDRALAFWLIHKICIEPCNYRVNQ